MAGRNPLSGGHSMKSDFKKNLSYVASKTSKMAEIKPGSFSKVMQKHAGRAKERILQNLGKADKTTDHAFDIYVHNFNNQQNVALKLQKELKNYVSCVKAMQTASKSLHDTVCEIYEQEWIGHEQIPVRTESIEMLWEDFYQKLNDQVSVPLVSYINQFPDIRAKVAKRGRKLVDYDGCRHTLDALQNASKKRDELKIAKAREQLEESRHMYEILNRELHDDLPALYDSRIPFFVSHLSTLFTAENVFHTETARVYTHLSELMEKLALENQKGTYTSRQPDSPIPPIKSERPYEEIDFKATDLEIDTNIRISGNQASWNLHENGVSESSTPSTKMLKKDVSPIMVRSGARTELLTPPVKENKKDDKEYEPVTVGAQLTQENHVPKTPDRAAEPRKVEVIYDIPVGATTTDLPPGILYRVRATYKYAAEDSDELCFETGEVIQVIEYDDPEEQEEGWLMGIKEGTSERGLFPANFTRPI